MQRPPLLLPSLLLLLLPLPPLPSLLLLLLSECSRDVSVQP
jgi:hypothetical protein